MQHLHINLYTMDFIGCRKGEAIMRLSGWSDALRLNGEYWSVDCLPSLLLHVWNRKGKIKVAFDGSDFEIEIIPHKKEN